MKFPALPTAFFLSLALNLFLVGVIAGSWREIRGQAERATLAAVAPGPSAPPEPPGSDLQEPAEAPPRAAEPRPANPVPAGGMIARKPPPPPAVLGPADEVVAPGPERSPGGPFPHAGGAPQRFFGNPLVLASRDLPPREARALQILLRAESEAVRADLSLARRERAETWRALARGEVGEAEANRRLEIAHRRELAARSRVENAVADWALRQSPEVRARVGEALAQGAQPQWKRPVRPFPPGEGQAPGAPMAAGES